MPEQAATAGAGTNAQQQGGSNFMSIISRLLMMYMFYNFMFGSKQARDPSTGVALPPHKNLFPGGENLNLFVYMCNDNETYSNFLVKECPLIWQKKGVIYNSAFDSNFETTLQFPVPEALQKNQSVFAHIYMVKSGYSHNPRDQDSFDEKQVIYQVHAMNKHMEKKKDTRKNLISGTSEETVEAQMKESAPEIEIINYWKPNLTLGLVDDHTEYAYGSIPPQIRKHMQFDNATSNYYPVLWCNEFWLFREHMIALNDTVKELNLTISVSVMSSWKWQLMVQMEESFTLQQSFGTSQEGDSEEFKRMLIETNPYLLGLTMVVTLLHSVFDFLAFKNDITFWKNKKTFEGLSIRTMFLNTACQVIVFLYLLDNDTSTIILVSSGIGLLIEFWKLRKAVIFEVDWSKRFPIIIKDRESYASETKEHDIVAMRYLSYALYPLLLGYAIYSLVYETHKSWYSWILSTLVGCVYTFGFIMMCPQLYLNYKLKSVAHLPFRAFMYKALNTFIDDLFAFIIKMPTMHRLSCFRDDIIFLIYLYQRWIYPVDKKRVNEFGQGGEEEPEPVNNETQAPLITESTSTTKEEGEKQNKEESETKNKKSKKED